MKLYQESPTRNVQLGIAMQLLACILMFCLEKFVFQNILFQFCKVRLNYFGNSTFENLMLLPTDFVGYWFLLYWLNRYTNEYFLKIGTFDLTRSLLFAVILTLLNFHCCFVKEIMPIFFRTYNGFIWTAVTTAYQFLIRIFVFPFVLYKGLDIETEKNVLNYQQFLKKALSFLIKKCGWIFALIGIQIVLYIINSFVCYLAFQRSGNNILDSDKICIRYVGNSILQIITFIFPMCLAKMYTSFAGFFIKKDE